MRSPATSSTSNLAPSTTTASPGTGRRPSALNTSPAIVRASSCGSDVPTASLKSSIVIEPATLTV
jgi:hypothetical protein